MEEARVDGLSEVGEMSRKEMELHRDFRCPNCGTTYKPVLDRKRPEMLIQEEFPKAPVWQREQHISGICSNECWEEFLGIAEWKGCRKR